MKDYLKIKKQLFSLCEEYVDNIIDTAQEAIDIAQNSANEETKSSSGDKYETGRSMMQLEIEKLSSQLAEGLKLKKTLAQINKDRISPIVQPGSIVYTNNGNFFISISAGKLNIDGTDFMAISYSSPIGQELFNKKVNDEFEFRGKKFIIESLK